jgi:hypothetical protein
MAAKPQKELVTLLQQGVCEFVCNSFRHLSGQNRLILRIVVRDFADLGTVKKLEEDDEARQWLSNLG